MGRNQTNWPLTRMCTLRRVMENRVLVRVRISQGSGFLGFYRFDETALNV
jgi:hypothetical protein